MGTGKHICTYYNQRRLTREALGGAASQGSHFDKKKNKTSSPYEWLYRGNVPTFGFKSEDRYTDRYTDTRTHTSTYTPTHHPTHMPPSLMLQ